MSFAFITKCVHISCPSDVLMAVTTKSRVFWITMSGSRRCVSLFQRNWLHDTDTKFQTLFAGSFCLLFWHQGWRYDIPTKHQAFSKLYGVKTQTTVLFTHISIGSQDSVVCIATGYGLDNRGVGVWVPVGSRILSSPCRPDWLCGQPNHLSNGYRGLFPRG
jgi:hypothetical protein